MKLTILKKLSRRNQNRVKRIATTALSATLVSTFLIAASGCGTGYGSSQLSAPTVSSSGQAVTQNNTICRSTTALEVALNGHYTGTIQFSNGSQNYDLFISTFTISGYTGNFLKAQFTTSGSLGNEGFESTLCAEVPVPSSSGSITELNSFAITPSANQTQLINRNLPYKFNFRASVNASSQFDPSQSLIRFMDCGSSQACMSTTPLVSMQITNLRKL